MAARNLACGVTTVLDVGAPIHVVRDVERMLSMGNPGPRYLTLGAILKPPGGLPRGYPDGWWTTNPQSVYSFHGPTSLRELELLQHAGLSPREALASATRIPAEMLGLQDEIGAVEVGKRADLVVTRNDPSGDVSAFRTIQWVIRDGVARTPAEWMAP